MFVSIIKKIYSISKINKKNEFKHECIKIVLIYMITGFIWIYFSDRIANELASNSGMLLIINTYKGCLYVIVTSIVLYLLISSLLKKVDLAEKKNSAIIEAIPDLLFVIDREGNFIDCMTSEDSLLLIPKEDFIGKTLWEVMPKEISKIAYKKIQLVLKSGVMESFEYELECCNKLQYYELRIVKNNEKEVLAISRNVTVQKQNELELKISEEKYKTLVTEMKQGLALYEGSLSEEGEIIHYRLLDANESHEKVTGLKKKDILGKNFIQIFPNMEKRLIEKIGYVAKTGDSIQYEYYVPERGKYYEIIAYRPKKLQLAVIFTDITVRKQVEESLKASEHKLEYLSYHDQLTGLYNRRFFEEKLSRLDMERSLPLTIIMADVNGLKLINDSFGHTLGDELLKKVAEVIMRGCRVTDIICRLGGDEFVILLPKTDTYEVEQIIKRIKTMALKEKVGSVDISISFGYETKNNEEEKIQDIFKKAEDHMYKKKLFESPSMRGKTISTIISTLHEKNKREEQHSYRVSALCQSMGKALDLPEDEIKELKTVGLLHDIGKIAIEEKVLSKPGKLTEEEWEEMKRHPEIGYRILSTVNDMSEMAEYVLTHHERWDGMGYPKGLKGEEISLQSRIITIADSYDAMISQRSYRNALSEEVAIEELKINAGLQFDPELIKVFITKVLNKPFD
ncbi:HD domain-containing phosphohydrolase [Tepidibacter hydrothermalis]|uniref:Diguanylate cyclase n=1 Tax=Tepidibacter hydrothermalis TaxID=3036126 RepID=A0ABY8EGI9_9FIRM|nr:HD domain-containing phosphohydrolase [Tepidibacter hydrothermalis]WFD11896.1 diguanylate cyclase [Tepidibacter hydrothermalis]